ncbi:MAG: hypothetical protein KKF48_02040 [Nanoarchaeota archaeon]|nr:hypothetical protein [Nanoarchaeota archaeon]MBU1027801.1 hypothetical protein [Nanoarchaeota archaeon]
MEYDQNIRRESLIMRYVLFVRLFPKKIITNLDKKVTKIADDINKTIGKID